MSRETRCVYVVALDGCIHDGDSAEYGSPNQAVISVIQREREEHHSVFIVNTRNHEFRSDLPAMLQGWGLGFCFTNTDPENILKVLSSEYDCELIHWNRVEDVLMSDFVAVCSAHAYEFDILTLVEQLSKVFGNLIYSIDASAEALKPPACVETAEKIADVEFALEALKQAAGLADEVAEARIRIVDEWRQMFGHTTDTPLEDTE